MGLGLSGGAWWRTVAALSRDFRVITFDNRGVGRSRGLTPKGQMIRVTTKEGDMKVATKVEALKKKRRD